MATLRRGFHRSGSGGADACETAPAFIASIWCRATAGERVMARRAVVVIAVLLFARFYTVHLTSAEAAVQREPLAALPLTIGSWQGHEAPPLADDVLAQLGVDDYVNREYFMAGSAPVGVYIGYYASQRQGDTIHSPQNCLPGAGWRPVETGIADLQSGGRTVRVNEFVIQNGL